jgi:hypothetical protein
VLSGVIAQSPVQEFPDSNPSAETKEGVTTLSAMLFVFSFGARRKCVRQLSPETGGRRGKQFYQNAGDIAKNRSVFFGVSSGLRISVVFEGKDAKPLPAPRMVS